MKQTELHTSLVLGLLHAAVGEKPPGLCAGIEDAPVPIWRDVIGFASAHGVLPALGPHLTQLASCGGAPLELADFAKEIRRANTERNRLLSAALRGVASDLDGIGIAPIALKGAAFLAEDSSGYAPWRFMQDLDLLIREDELARSVSILTAQGYTPASQDYRPDTHAHYPPMLSPCRTFSIELHTRLFALDDYGLPAACVCRDAVSAGQFSPGLRIPSTENRIQHVLLHAQLHNRGYAMGRIVLKDLLDLSILSHQQGASVDASAEQIDEPAAQRAALALVAAWHMWRGDQISNRAAGAWATTAFDRLSRPRWLNYMALPAEVGALEWYRLRHERGHLRRRAALLARPDRLSQAAAAWAFKQRNRLWS